MFIVRLIIFLSLVASAAFSLSRLQAFNDTIFTPPKPAPDFVLDLQFGGYSCTRAQELISLLNDKQKGMAIEIYTKLYDIYWPLSVLFVTLYLVHWRCDFLS